MNAFRYQAMEASGTAVQGVIEAEDRRSALQLLGRRGLCPSRLEPVTTLASPSTSPSTSPVTATATPAAAVPRPEAPAEGRVKRKEVTAFTREMGALLAAAIPIPSALESLGEGEESPAFRAVMQQIGESVNKGELFSAALAAHPRVFSRLYVSMIRVGEEAGLLPKVMNDLADLLEHEDEVRGEVITAVSYPLFVLGFGLITVTILLTVVLPRLFSMLEEMSHELPLPTVILLAVSHLLSNHWFLLLIGLIGAVAGLWKYFSTEAGAEMWDKALLRLPLIGPVCQAAALGRFARTLGTLVRSGVSLLPALKIVEQTIGNRLLAAQIARVAEETRGGDSLAAPLRALGVFPRAVVQMIAVGEESGRLDEMLLKVADIEERHMRARTKTLISLIAPALILGVGLVVGFMVIAILLPIFKMSHAIH